MDRKSWVLLAIAHPAEGRSAPRGLDQVRLIKTLFLVQERYPEIEGLDFEFAPYLYGPFTADIYWQAEELAREGLITIAQGSGRRRVYAPTPLGAERAEEVGSDLHPVALQFLVETREWAMRSSFQAIVRRIYEEFPAYKQNSVFQG